MIIYQKFIMQKHNYFTFQQWKINIKILFEMLESLFKLSSSMY